MEPMEQNGRPQGTLSKIGSFFRVNQNPQKKLSTWKQCGEQDEWATRAVDVLVKKLKKQPLGLKKIEIALQTQNPLSECVTIPRSIDGRLQISNCKALPHVIYCRVWRWPDLQSHHELRSVRNCEFPFSAKDKTDSVCINPYHYTRVESGNIFPPVLVPRHAEFAPGFSKLPQLQMPEPSQMPGNVVLDNNSPTSSYGTYPQSTMFDNNSPTNSYGAYNPQGTFNQGSSQTNYYNNYTHPNGQYYSMDAMPSPPHYQEPNGMVHDQDGCSQVFFEEPEYWASVAYYELNVRVGEQFRCSTNSYSFTVDGFTDPSTSNRFCLGQLSNVNRNSTIESVRKHIGKGLVIYLENNEMHLECLSESPIFVQSRMMNYQKGFPPSTVCKLMPNSRVRMFDNNEFHRLLKQVVTAGFEPTYALTKMCTIRISYVKGWGEKYHRQDVTSTPCWIEIHLNAPLKWLDQVLIEMGSPLYQITSQS